MRQHVVIALFSMVALAATIAIFAIAGLVPHITLNENIVGTATSKVLADDTPVGYAPSLDPTTRQAYLRATWNGALQVSAGGENWYVYRTGHYLTDADAWIPFTFDHAASDGWIRGTATASVEDAPPAGRVIAYLCRQGNQGGSLVCGLTGADESRWTIASYGCGCLGKECFAAECVGKGAG